MITIPGKKLFSLQYKFMIISLSITLIPLLVVGGFSYIRSTAIIEEKVSQSNYNTVRQVADNINLIFSDMANSANYLWQNKEFMKYLKMSREEVAESPNILLSAQNSVNNFIVFKANIYSLYVRGFNGLEFDTTSAENRIGGSLQQQLTDLHGESVLIYDTVTNYNNTRTKVISLLRLFKDIDNLSSDLAIIKINISEDEISKAFQSRQPGTRGDYFIVDEQKNIISSQKKESLGTKLAPAYDDSRLYAGASGYFKDAVDGHNYLVTYFNLSRPGWKMVNMVPLDEVLADAMAIQKITFFTMMISLALCLIVIIMFSTRVLSPLKQIRKSMKHLENENFDVGIEVKGNDEIALLGNSFNKMSKRLGELINEVYAVQIKQKEADLKALQAQINPHFLYNTLDTIYWMCRMEKAFESSNLVQALSRLFRLSLNSGNEFTTVRNEIDHLQNYITIQDKRFDGMIRFNIDASDEVLECKVVKLVLQPLVENAIHHGIEKSGGRGNIDVRIFKEEGNVVYIVGDDGAGADEKELNSFLEQVGEGNRGFGIKNVSDRIRLYFGNDYGIAFRSSPGNGTVVTVRQPFVIGGMANAQADAG